MFVDTKALDQDSIVRAQVCVIGAGPAGISIATELAGTGISVAVLESGGLDTDATDLGQPAATSRFADHRGIWTTRQFGGNGNMWHVNAGVGPNHLRLLPLHEADLEKRDWVADSGWPIPYADLAPYYERAQAWFALEPRGYAPDAWEGPNAPRLPLEGTGLRTGMFHFAYKNVILDTYRQALDKAENVTVYTNATVARLDTDESGERVTGATAVSAPGRSVRFGADMFILAQGGLATPQLLLSSTNAAHPTGIGNANDLVGRYFMDHPLLFGGLLIPKSRDLIDRMGLYDLRRVDGMSAMGHLQFTDALLRTERCANISAILFPRRSMSARREAGFQASRRLRAALQKRGPWATKDLFTTMLGVDGFGQQLYDRLVSPISHLGVGGWSQKTKPSERFDHFEVLHQAEQTPHRDNRVKLAEERDALGNRRIEIHCTWRDEDRELVYRAQDVMAREIAKSGIGEFRIQRPFEMKTSSTTHFLGATRMSADPRDGVVDTNGRVHGVPNLMIAGSAVFPTGGYANPTLSLVAMAIRAADRVKRDLQAPALRSETLVAAE